MITESATLPVGDYSLPGFEDRAVVERKSLDGLVSCLRGRDRERFERELSRGRAYDLFSYDSGKPPGHCVKWALSV